MLGFFAACSTQLTSVDQRYCHHELPLTAFQLTIVCLMQLYAAAACAQAGRCFSPMLAPVVVPHVLRTLQQAPSRSGAPAVWLQGTALLLQTEHAVS